MTEASANNCIYSLCFALWIFLLLLLERIHLIKTTLNDSLSLQLLLIRALDFAVIEDDDPV